MSEYWKSTPKYWCKHCKTYIRDTKLEKANHEATPKHQGNLKRFLRDLHRGHEKDERDKERAKAEVARLNGLPTGSGSSHASSSRSGDRGGSYSSIGKPQATAAQRKQQLAQLAEMGISIPDEFRPEMAMVGEWQVTSEKVIEPEGSEKKPDALALGVRKRLVEDEDEEAMEAKKRRWGSTYKTHPSEDEEADLDSLLNSISRRGREPEGKSEVKEGSLPEVKIEPEASLEKGQFHDLGGEIKKEPPEIETPLHTSDIPPDTALREEEGGNLAGVVFKKRKAKNFRQK